VDITNYITFDRGRPLHVFDAKKVKGNLVVRRAQEGEAVLALDGRTYRLDPAVVVIADENGVESIGGIMGGEHSGCDEATTDVLIESALWDPLNIAQTGRRLGIITDARYRFERGVDPAFAVPGLELATRMVVDLCGGEAGERKGSGTGLGPSGGRGVMVGSQCSRPQVSVGVGVSVRRRFNEVAADWNTCSIVEAVSHWWKGEGEAQVFVVPPTRGVRSRRERRARSRAERPACC